MSFATAQHAHEGPKLCHARLLLIGAEGGGQDHVAAALMDAMPGTTCFLLDTGQLVGCPKGRSSEEIMKSVFADAHR